MHCSDTFTFYCNRNYVIPATSAPCAIHCMLSTVQPLLLYFNECIVVMRWWIQQVLFCLAYTRRRDVTCQSSAQVWITQCYLPITPQLYKYKTKDTGMLAKLFLRTSSRCVVIYFSRSMYDSFVNWVVQRNKTALTKFTLLE